MGMPPALISALTRLLGAPPQAVRAIGGGDISAAARFQAGGQTYLVKWHLLNHLNLFGKGYGAQLDAVLRRYAA